MSNGEIMYIDPNNKDVACIYIGASNQIIDSQFSFEIICVIFDVCI